MPTPVAGPMTQSPLAFSARATPPAPRLSPLSPQAVKLPPTQAGLLARFCCANLSEPKLLEGSVELRCGEPDARALA